MDKAFNRKFREFPSHKYHLTSYCNVCGNRKTINQDSIPEMTFADFREKSLCSHCFSKGMTVSITIKKSLSAFFEAVTTK